MKPTKDQLSIFDIVINHDVIPEVLPSKPEIKATPKIIQPSDKNLCPYKIPEVDEIIKQIEKAAYRVNKSKLISDVFECGALAISNLVDKPQYDAREQRYLEIIKTYKPDEQKLLSDIFAMIFALCSSVVYDDGVFNDYLGEIFMRCNQANSAIGQVFTPYHISKLMAKCTITDSDITKNEVITVNDPCCGGGVMLLAALDVLKNDYGVNYAYNCFMDAGDVDIRCVHMAYIQLSLAGVPAIIKHQNALSRELWSVWKTPAFIFQYLRFHKYANYN